MRVEVAISDGALRPGGAEVVDRACEHGARVVFEGIIRREEAGRVLVAIDYQTYEPMAQNQLRLLAEEIGERLGVAMIGVEHSRGVVNVGECSFRLTVISAHRKEALKAMDEFIDRMKKDVPIFKRPVFAE